METLLSKIGIPFTRTSVEALQLANTTTPNLDLKHIIVASVSKNGPSVSLAADFSPAQGAAKDSLQDIIFYWYAEPKMLEWLKGCILDINLLQGSRIISAPANPPPKPPETRI